MHAGGEIISLFNQSANWKIRLRPHVVHHANLPDIKKYKLCLEKPKRENAKQKKTMLKPGDKYDARLCGEAQRQTCRY